MTRSEVEGILKECTSEQVLEVVGLDDNQEALVDALEKYIEDSLEEIISSMVANGLIDLEDIESD